MAFRYSSPFTQIIIVSLICFCCPGMFNALAGLGAAGKSDPFYQDQANTALSVTFAIFSLLGGGIFNIVGHRITLFIGGLTYAIYVGAFLSDNGPFTIFAGALLGIGAGFLWSAQGAIMMSYPKEENKGKYFATFWMIFNIGAVLGALIPLVKEWNSPGSSVSAGTYIGFIVVMCIGSIISLALLPPSKVSYEDGTPVSIHKYSNVTREAIEIAKLFGNWKMLLLIPLFAGSNYLYTYQFNVYNAGGWFNLRARTLNNLLYWSFQIIGAGLFGLFLDNTRLTRPQRAWGALAINFVMFAAVWIGAVFFQRQFTRSYKADGGIAHDIQGDNYGGELILFALFGSIDATYQGFCYWLMGALTNDTERAARYAGFYKAIQNVFNAVASQVDGTIKAEFMTELAISWGICAFGMICAIPVIRTIGVHTDEVIENVDEALAVETAHDVESNMNETKGDYGRKETEA